MPVTVRVRNVQSIVDATIVIDGFTVIFGSNNSGKTAIMRAIKGVFTNAPAGPLVRHGAAHLQVDMDFGDGNTVTWKKGWTKPDQKGATVNEYTVNGKKLGTKVGRGCPDEVAALGVQFIDAGTDRLWPQIADQFSGVLFLVNTPGSTVAEAVADVDRVGKLTTALKLSEKDRRAVISTLKIRRKDLEHVADDVEAFKGFDDVIMSVDSLDAQLKEADTQTARLTLFQGLHTRWNAVRGDVDSLDGVEDLAVPDAVIVKEARKHASRIRDLMSLADRHKRVSATTARFEGLDDLRVPQAHLAQDERAALQGLLVLQGDYHTASDSVARLEGVAGVSVPSEKDLARVRKTRNALRLFVDIKSRYSTLEAEVSRLEREIEDAGVEHKDAQAEVGAIITELGICPTCRRPADEVHEHEEVIT